MYVRKTIQSNPEARAAEQRGRVSSNMMAMKIHHHHRRHPAKRCKKIRPEQAESARDRAARARKRVRSSSPPTLLLPLQVCCTRLKGKAAGRQAAGTCHTSRLRHRCHDITPPLHHRQGFLSAPARPPARSTDPTTIIIIIFTIRAPCRRRHIHVEPIVKSMIDGLSCSTVRHQALASSQAVVVFLLDERLTLLSLF